MKYALNQPSWRRLWGRCELGECLVLESEADGDSARSSVAAVEEGAQRRPLQAVADGDSARGSVAAVEEGAQRRPLQAVVRELEAGWAKVGEGWSEVADLEGAGSGDASCREEVGRRGHMYIYTHISYNIYVHIDMGRSGGVGRLIRHAARSSRHICYMPSMLKPHCASDPAATYHSITDLCSSRQASCCASQDACCWHLPRPHSIRI